ncbi:MAG: hypothetical protein AAF497_22170 [Planctomycetota bacterium]
MRRIAWLAAFVLACVGGCRVPNPVCTRVLLLDQAIQQPVITGTWAVAGDANGKDVDVFVVSATEKGTYTVKTSDECINLSFSDLPNDPSLMLAQFSLANTTDSQPLSILALACYKKDEMEMWFLDGEKLTSRMRKDGVLPIDAIDWQDGEDKDILDSMAKYKTAVCTEPSKFQRIAK